MTGSAPYENGRRNTILSLTGGLGCRLHADPRGEGGLSLSSFIETYMATEPENGLVWQITCLRNPGTTSVDSCTAVGG